MASKTLLTSGTLSGIRPDSESLFTGGSFVTGGEAREGEEGVGQEAQREVAVPGVPLPDLLMIHPALSFCLFEGTLYGPTLLANSHQFFD